MSNVPTRRTLMATAGAAALLAACGDAQRDKSRLEILNGGAVHAFTVEVAGTEAAWAKGLAGRASIRDDEGLLFDYGEVRTGVVFWMKDAPLSLDILFIDAKGVVFRIERETVPRSEDLIPAGGPVRAVLELKGGTAARLSIEPGAVVRHAIFAK